MEDLIQIPTPKYIKAYAESRIGGRSENQDSFGYAETPYGFLVTVCDGMGGGPGGKTASSIAVEEIINGVKEGNIEDTVPNILIKAIRRANMAIINYGMEKPELKGMGSTCTVLIISEKCATVAHVGDSRVYQLRGKSKVFRTFDHSMVFDLVKQGVISEEQARLSAQSNVITRALGVKLDVEVDVVELSYETGDRFLLCTDGIHGTMPETQLIAAVSDRKLQLGAITDTLATTVDGTGRSEGGGHDNLTLAIVETNINSKLKQTMSKNMKISFLILCVVCAISLIVNVFAVSSKSEVEFKDGFLTMDSVTYDKNFKDSVQIKVDNDTTTITYYNQNVTKKENK
ncbi:MAG: serine/threonine-protein phosphatase [Muribaculaceae bacterium]|nr:serine/threonine-protein phosphatase [Muribaculaceae bacterium]